MRMIDDEPWYFYAACKGMAQENGSYDLFFSDDPTAQRAAKKICNTCEVRSDCLAYAFEEKIWDGIWGGMTENGRRKLRRKLFRERKMGNIPQLP